MKRFFLFSYTGNAAIGGMGTGHLTMNTNGVFPSLLEIQRIANQNNAYQKTDDIILTHVFEFKNEEDYNSFIE